MEKKLNEILVVCDLENTLLTPEHELLACNLEMVRLFCALGGNFTIASDCSFAQAKKALKGLVVNAPAIVAGGCEIIDFSSGEILEQQTMDKQQAQELFLQISARFPAAGVSVLTAQGRTYVLTPSDLMEQQIAEEKRDCLYAPMEEIEDEWCKLTVVDSPRVIQGVVALAEGREYDAVKPILTSHMHCEIMPETAGKAQALKAICRKSEFALANTVAIGDYYNDIEFMKTAGYSVAMGNSPSEVKFAASEIAGDCRDGGVASYLYHLIKLYS